MCWHPDVNDPLRRVEAPAVRLRSVFLMDGRFIVPIVASTDHFVIV